MLYISIFKSVTSQPAKDFARASVCVQHVAGPWALLEEEQMLPLPPKEFISTKNPVAIDFQMNEIGLNPVP